MTLRYIISGRRRLSPERCPNRHLRRAAGWALALATLTVAATLFGCAENSFEPSDVRFDVTGLAIDGRHDRGLLVLHADKPPSGDQWGALCLVDFKSRKAHLLAGALRTGEVPDEVSFAGDGTKIAYTLHTSEILSMQEYNLNTHERRTLAVTNASTYEDDPSWSPDGRYVTFCRARTVGTFSLGARYWYNYDIWKLDVHSGYQIRLSNSNYFSASDPHFAGDGKYVYYSASTEDSLGNESTNVYRVPADSSSSPLELTHDGESGDPVVTPDDKYIFFMHPRTEVRSIWVANSNGSDARPLVTDKWYKEYLNGRGNPDRVIFLSDRPPDGAVIATSVGRPASSVILDGAFLSSLAAFVPPVAKW
jgi:Tol biopolymer transport system component